MTRTTCKPHQSEGGPPGWWKEIATTQLGGSGAAAGPVKGASRGARDTRPIGATGAREVPPGGCIEGVWSSGPTGLPPYVASARVARPTPGGQRGARAWPEKPKGNERKRKGSEIRSKTLGSPKILPNQWLHKSVGKAALSLATGGGADISADIGSGPCCPCCRGCVACY